MPRNSYALDLRLGFLFTSWPAFLQLHTHTHTHTLALYYVRTTCMHNSRIMHNMKNTDDTSTPARLPLTRFSVLCSTLHACTHMHAHTTHTSSSRTTDTAACRNEHNRTTSRMQNEQQHAEQKQKIAEQQQN